ncbi:putative metallophosphoesterase At3g03305 [Bidens hawaiensis]|uniref:putative metallophosphoesterase At3g03305 n=1 Tax=Bidens hawaiensis TaxID=980011 RepID=UPI00404A8F0D
MKLLILLLLCYNCIGSDEISSNTNNNRDIIQVQNSEDDVVWIVQLSDLHFSVHYPERAFEFQQFVSSTLSMINPSLVLITGDLTDGKSKDHLIMKQNEEEWIEYQNAMKNVITTSGLDKNIFYDVRGNHDKFGVPNVGGAFDFFSNYSVTGQLGRSQSVNSVTLQTSSRNLLFVSFDSTMSTGLRGPTNLFGHPTDQLLNELNSHLSQWDATSAKSSTKIAFGHFPLSFSAPTNSGRTLKQIFLNQSITAYLCGHFHLKFGKNLKRHHETDLETGHSPIQLNIHQKGSSSSIQSCQKVGQNVNEFWELEMGDWRKSRAIRVMAIDKGRVSFIDTDLKTGSKEILILPTYPLDSRFISTDMLNKYKCQSMEDTAHIRALVFSSTTIASVKAKIYDSVHGDLKMVLEASMNKNDNFNLYTVPWNSEAFIDPSVNRYWLQIEAVDINDKTVSTELIPFSLSGLRADLSWTWKEAFVMGIQWAELYYPIFWSFYFLVFIILILPKIIIFVWKKQYSYKYFKANKGVISFVTWVFAEVDNIQFLWKLILAYLLYLILCPWFLGQVFTKGGDRGYMTYKGWVVNFNDLKNLEFIGFPDVMVIVIPHIYFVVLPAVIIIGAVVAERAVYQDHVCSLSGKKRDDGVDDERIKSSDHISGWVLKMLRKWARVILAILSMAVCWKHLKNCWSLMKAYEMNPLVHFPFYSFSIPLLLVYVFYKTKRL